MEKWHPARLGLMAVLTVAAVASIGCGNRSFTDEMRTQEVEMTSEASQWTEQVATWDNDHHEMKAWHAEHPVPSTDSPRAETLREHEEKMAKHEQDVEQFRRDLEAHRNALQAESAKPENDRVSAHAALWADHLKLESTYNMLNAAHQDLAKEHESFVSGAEGETPPPTGS